MKKIRLVFLSLVLLLSVAIPSISGGLAHAATNDGQTIHTAIPVPLPSALKGNLERTEYMYYKVTIPENGALTAAMTNTQNSVNVSIMDGAQNNYSCFSTPTNIIGETKRSVGFKKGDIVYIKVDNWSFGLEPAADYM